MSRRVVVLGSANVDYTFRAERLPMPGETVGGDTFAVDFGGKGANQAVAAARLGADVCFLGCIGDDAAGEALLAALAADGINTESVIKAADVPTGSAGISVDRAGSNSIIVVAGANGLVDPQHVARWQDTIVHADSLLMQLEVPVNAVSAAARIATDAGVRVVLDPAPLDGPLPSTLRGCVDLLTPNEAEARRLLGDAVGPEHAALALARQFDATTILTRGEAGCVVATADGSIEALAAKPADVVSTVAAGDTFNGALATALADGEALVGAIEFAQYAAALSVERDGAQRSMPYRHELTKLSR
ncbi:MAG: ribokinase [Pseudomonadota bacterium]